MRNKYVLLPIILIQLILVLMFSTEAKDEDDYEYLIVTTDVLKDGWNEFVEFNQRRCLRTKIQTIDYIKANIQGVDDADKLRNYIKQEFENHNIVYVLLGGDDDNNNGNDIPHRGFRVYEELNPDPDLDYDFRDIPADMYYSCLNGTWKVSGSSYYGEYGSEDIGWEVYAARFAVDNQTELNNMINKTIKYSEKPVVNELKNALLTGEYLWGPPNYPVECYGKFYMEELRGLCDSNGYTTIGIPDSWNTSTLYDYDNEWTSTDLINTVINNKTAWINHIGHTNNSFVMKTMSSSVSTSNFTNNGDNANYFLVYAQCTYSAAFDNKTSNGSYSNSDCIAEKFTSEISNGAVAFIGNSRISFADVETTTPNGTNGANQKYQRYFHDAIFNKKIHYLEMMNAYTKEININEIVVPPEVDQSMKFEAYEINILGDPALSVWTETPQELTPQYAINKDTVFEMQTHPYTWVALLDKDYNIICTQLTIEDGICKIDDPSLKEYIANNSIDDVRVRIKAHNYFPYEGDMTTAISNKNAGEVPFVNGLYYQGINMSINYALPVKGHVNISFYNSKGTLVKTIANENQNPGKHTVTFRSDYLSNGIYYIKFSVNDNAIVKKAVVIK